MMGGHVCTEINTDSNCVEDQDHFGKIIYKYGLPILSNGNTSTCEGRTASRDGNGRTLGDVRKRRGTRLCL